MPPEYEVTITLVGGDTWTFDASRYDVRTSPEEGFVLVLDTEHMLNDTVSIMSVPREQVRMVRVEEKV